MNDKIISELSRQIDYYKSLGNEGFRIKQLSKATSVIQELKIEITNPEKDLKGIKGIGKGVIERCKTILKEGSLNIPVINNEWLELTNVHGVGEKQAKKLYDAGIKNVKDLKRFNKTKVKKPLSHAIQLGLKYYDDFNQRIPREEITEFENVCNKLVKDLSTFKWSICGSYRRGKADCGDIDILCTSSKKSYSDMKAFIQGLKNMKYIIDDLTPNATKKYMGVARLKEGGLARRIDIRFVNYDQYGSAMLYFTGNKDFNIMMRNKAIDKGYKLNEYGLFDAKTNEQFDCHSEETIFTKLGMDYIVPEHRTVSSSKK